MFYKTTLLAAALTAFVFNTVARAEGAACTPVNFKEMPLGAPEPNVAIASLLAAYPDLSYDADSAVLTFAGGAQAAFEPATDRPSDVILTDATVGDQFRYVYPLDFALEARKTPWHDPGRVRNDAFMRALYFDSKRAAKKTLTRVKSAHGAAFKVTTRHGVDCQLGAVFSRIGTAHPTIFNHIGGSFNWRNISGTKRLSVHSFGAAVDVNSKLGGYWKWSGEAAGAVGNYRNQIPQSVVEAFETYGFIWGGKWHHYDGMHFEYRPELILHARLVAPD